MSENTIPHSSSEDKHPGHRLRLTSLAPLFDKARHQLYFDLLVRAIGAEGTRNIALTGAYGTGKSSVLGQLSRTEAYKGRVVELSLSTIAPEVDARDEEPKPGSRTNQIQKEIVKQLLYRLPPSAVPRSRFRRASTPNVVRDWWVAGIAGGSTFVLLFGLGLLHPPVEALLTVPWRQVVAYVLLFALMVCAAWTINALVRSRPTMSASVQTGAATITLSKQSDTYFDEYLDEIVYFFQVSRRDIVVIEDIDRFEDVQVFDTLRALNGLLNSSDQLGRRIVFIYAIRDSVFEQIGAKRDGNRDQPGRSAGDTDRAKAALKRASRTKFFDVIIPVVPFVSADNARDVMSEAMESNDFEIDPALIRLAARHVADMRMIHNIRNEFEVYRNRLVVPEDRIPGIDDNLVFAIVLFKNTHLADFEKIRHRDSTLDQLYLVWRALVRSNLADHTKQITKHQQSRHLAATRDERAANLGRRLVELRDMLQAAARTAAPKATVELSGPATDANVEDPATWSQITTEGSQRLSLHDPTRHYYGASFDLSFTADQLTGLLGTSLRTDDWETVALRDFDEKITQEEEHIRFLRHHTWEELCAHPEFTVDASQFRLEDSSGKPIEKSISFNEVVEAVLESDLARDLVRHGFLTSHFALYASSYYGNHLGPEAMEYIRRCVDPGLPDASFPMSEEDVIQLLRDQDADKSDTAEFFNDASVFNLSILDYLLLKRPAAAATVAQRLSILGKEEQEFVDTYVAQGQHPGALLAAMAPYWTGVLKYAAGKAPADPDSRPAHLDAVLRALPHHKFDVGRDVKQAVESNYRDIGAIYDPESAERANIVLQVVQATGAVLESLEPLNSAAREVAIRLRLFPITEANLRVIVPTGPVALDVLRSNKNAYGYAIDRIEDYLAVMDASPETVHAVADPSLFAAVLTDAAKSSNAALLRRLIDNSNPKCRVPDLADVAAEAWPFLAASERTDPTFDNISAYLQEVGMNEHLGSLLNKYKRITNSEGFSEDERREVAISVLAASKEIPSSATRVRIAASIEPGFIEATSLVPEAGDLVARLLKRRLVADDANAFSNDLMVDWATLEATISASKKYATFVTPDVLDVSHIPSLLRSSIIPKETVLAVVSKISAYLTDATIPQVRAVARALVDTRWRLPYESLEALRSAGASTGQVISLIAARGDQLPLDQLKMLLRALGGDYVRIADGGRGRPTFTVEQAHEVVLNRLVGDTVKHIETETFKLKGRRLVAPLLQPGA